MNDRPKTAETPIERALRMKNAALAAKPKSPRGDKLHPRQVGGMAAGASRPASRK